MILFAVYILLLIQIHSPLAQITSGLDAAGRVSTTSKANANIQGQSHTGSSPSLESIFADTDLMEGFKKLFLSILEWGKQMQTILQQKVMAALNGQIGSMISGGSKSMNTLLDSLSTKLGLNLLGGSNISPGASQLNVQGDSSGSSRNGFSSAIEHFSNKLRPNRQNTTSQQNAQADGQSIFHGLQNSQPGGRPSSTSAEADAAATAQAKTQINSQGSHSNVPLTTTVSNHVSANTQANSANRPNVATNVQANANAQVSQVKPTKAPETAPSTGSANIQSSATVQTGGRNPQAGTSNQNGGFLNRLAGSFNSLVSNNAGLNVGTRATG